MRFGTFKISKLSWKVCSCSPIISEKSCKILKAMFKYHGLISPLRSAISPRCSLKYESCSTNALNAFHCSSGVTITVPLPSTIGAKLISLASFGM